MNGEAVVVVDGLRKRCGDLVAVGGATSFWSELGLTLVFNLGQPADAAAYAAAVDDQRLAPGAEGLWCAVVQNLHVTSHAGRRNQAAAIT